MKASKGSTTLSSFILTEQRLHPEATGDFTMILERIAFVAKVISREVNKAGIANITGAVGNTNVHGENQQKLDVFANTQMITALNNLGLLCGMASEEADDVILIPDTYPKGKYLIVFDPLDGSSNIDVNVSIGSIFGIYKKSSGCDNACEADFLQKGCDIVAAGYVIYGSSTMFVYSTGNGVNGFTLDPSVGEFILSHHNIETPQTGRIYSTNEGNYYRWEDADRNCVDAFKKAGYSGRYIGSMVADFHRNLLQGGIFMYPADLKNPKGKLRLLYEAIPLSFIAVQAGGKAIDGVRDILQIVPDKIHQRIPLYIGSANDVEQARTFFK